MSDSHYADDRVTLYAGDSLEVLPTLPDNSVDAVCTDPPYGLEFMGKDWDSFKTYAAGGNNMKPKGATANGSTYGFRPDGSTQATHGYRQKQPRCRRCGKLIGRGTGVCKCPEPIVDTRTAESANQYQYWCELWAAECLRILKPGGHLLAFGGTRTYHRLGCAIEDAGFEIRDSCLDIEGRPVHDCHNPDCDPLLGVPGLAWLQGAGFPKSLNVGRSIDLGSCREAGTHTSDPAHVCPDSPAGDPWRGFGTALKPAFEPVVVARKPLVGTVAGNVLRYGTGALNIDAARIGTDEKILTHGGAGNVATYGDWERQYEKGSGREYRVGGRWPANVVLDGHAAQELDQQSGESTSATPSANGRYGEHEDTGGNAILGRGLSSSTPNRAPIGDSGGPSRFYFTAKASTDERITHNGVAHPTVKPLDLMRWLVRLVVPPGGVCLEPFAGSGTTVEAALLEGFRCIAIEREPDYLPLIVQRINRRRDPVAYITAAGEDLGLFGLDEGA